MSTLVPILETTAVRIPIGGGTWLDADVAVPPDAQGVVLFAHGSGSSRHSPRNRHVAGTLNDRQIATVLVDLFTPMEEILDERGALRFDIVMLTSRLERIIEWAGSSDLVATFPIGLFGASTGAAAALDAAAARPDVVRAVVSRGGRPDLASRLSEVEAPTLLIVGGRDTDVLRMNDEALRRLRCPKKLHVIAGATHLFEEPGTLEEVASIAGAWFREQFTKE